MDKIKQLLESESIDDVSLGVSYLYNKFDGHVDSIKEFLENVISKNKIDFYIGNLNIVSWGVKIERIKFWSVYTAAGVNELYGSPVIRL